MNTLKNISNQDLIIRLKKLARTERKITHQILLHISEIESRKIFAELAFDSMYSYLTQGLGYSDGAAYRRLQSARLLNQVPEIAEKLENGTLNLTQLTQVQKCLKEEAKKSKVEFSKEQTLSILEKLENKNSFETQKTLACEMNLPISFHENVRPQKDDSVRLEITFTKEQYEELESAKSLLSHICTESTWADVIAALASQFNKKSLKGRKPTPHSSSPASDSTQTNESNAHCKIVAKIKKFAPKSRRIYISIKSKRSLFEKANHCCEYKNEITGKKCQSKYQLQVDHIQPLALGGSHDITNLRILCRTHNLLAAQKAGLIRHQAKSTPC